MLPLYPYARLLILSLLLISFTFNPSAQAADPPLTLDGYRQKMQETQVTIAALEGMPLETQLAQLALLADQWEQITQVTLPDGTQMTVKHTFLAAQLRANPPDLARLKGHLTTWLEMQRHWPQAKHSPDDAELFSSILARPEFQWQPPQPSPLAEWWQEIQRRFWNFLASLLPEQTVISIDGSLIRYAFTGLTIIVLLAVLGLTLRSLLADFVAEAEARLDAETSDEILTAETALKRAQTLSSAGDYRTAVRYLYLSSLLLLEERGLLRYNRTQTNREYLRSLVHLPQLATTLREVIEVFDRVWYGYQPLDEATYAHYAAQVAKLRQQK